MSMITGCPACGTLFKVVPDQLKISEGWVRCGHCGEVFDASASMQRAPVATPEAGAPTAPTALPDAKLPAPARPAAPEPPSPHGTAPSHPSTVEIHDDSDVPSVTSRFLDDATEVSSSFLSRRDDGLGYPPLDFVRSEMEVQPSRFTGFDDAGEDEDEDEAVEQASFVLEARRKAFWRRPLVRLALVAVVLALAALLAGQVALHERDRLAATQPQLRPWLELACARLSCTIGPPQRIDAVVIDSSGFTKLRPDAYRLSFTLKNQSQQPVAVPSLELTLTDTADQPLLRRVFGPRELGAATDTLAAAAEWSSSLAIAVGTDANAARIAGYRLLAFYP